MSPASYERELGTLQADMKNTKSMVDDIKGQLAKHAEKTEEEFALVNKTLGEIVASVNQIKGGWKTLSVLGVIAGGAGAVAGKALLVFFR